MNGLTSRSRDAATPEERGHDSRSDPPAGREHRDPASGDHASGDRSTPSGRPRGHDPVADEIGVDGAPIPVDRCRFCGAVVTNPQRPGGPCPGLNRTLNEFGVTPTTGRDGETEPPIGNPPSSEVPEDELSPAESPHGDRSSSPDHRDEDARERTPVLASQ